MSFMEEIRKIPPVTRFLCASSLAVTLPVMLQLVSPYRILFVKELVTEKWEVWRVFTSFFFGGSGISFLFDFIMLYRNSDALESTHYARRSADYAWQLLLTAAGILALNIPFHSYLHFRALLLSTIYINSRLSPNSSVSLFGLVTIPNVYFPYTMLAMDFISGGGLRGAAGSLTGLMVGHVWWMLVWDGPREGNAVRGRAPEWMKAIVGDGANPGVGPAAPGAGAVGGGVRVIPPRAQREAAQVRGYQWGSGNRLGDR